MFSLKLINNVILSVTMMFSLTSFKDTFNLNKLDNINKICISQDDNMEKKHSKKNKKIERVKLKPEKEVKVNLNNKKINL